MSRKSKAADLPGIEGPGVAPVRITKIDALADDYIRERDKRCAQTPKEIAAKTKLIEAIHANADKIGKDRDGTLVYRYEDVIVILKPGKDVLQVKTVPSTDDEE